MLEKKRFASDMGWKRCMYFTAFWLRPCLHALMYFTDCMTHTLTQIVLIWGLCAYAVFQITISIKSFDDTVGIRIG